MNLHQREPRQEKQKPEQRGQSVSAQQHAAGPEAYEQPRMRPSGRTLLALQARFGNRHVQRTVDASRGAGLAQPRVPAHGPASSAAPVQRKLRIGGNEYQPDADEPPVLRAAADDEFVRFYESKDEMTKHLVEEKPVPVGLIKSHALWYRLPYLPDQFFVFGESHTAVRGRDVKKESNIKHPILDEAKPGWDFSEKPGQPDKGPDENSSKLLSALQALWALLTAPSTSSQQPAAGPALPAIPADRAGAWETETGSYPLAVRGAGGQPEWWKPRDASQPAKQTEPTWNLGEEAIQAVLELFPKVEKQNPLNLDRSTARSVLFNWNRFETEISKRPAFPSPADLDKDKQTIDVLYRVTKTMMKARYVQFRKNLEPSEAARYTDPGSPALQTEDGYRNEFILAAILAANKEKHFAFATMGGRHVRDLAARFTAVGVPFVSMEDFYREPISRVALDSGQRDETANQSPSGNQSAGQAPQVAKSSVS